MPYRIKLHVEALIFRALFPKRKMMVILQLWLQTETLTSKDTLYEYVYIYINTYLHIYSYIAVYGVYGHIHGLYTDYVRIHRYIILLLTTDHIMNILYKNICYISRYQ